MQCLRNEPTCWSCLDQGSSRAQPRPFVLQSLRHAKEADIVVSYWSPRMFLPRPPLPPTKSDLYKSWDSAQNEQFGLPEKDR